MRARLFYALIIIATLILASSLQAQDKAASTGKKDATVQAASGSQYSCPMHSDVTSGNPGKCSKCGMELTKKKSADEVKSANGGAKKNAGKGCCAKPCSEPCEEK
jgi:hypothetical protein